MKDDTAEAAGKQGDSMPMVDSEISEGEPFEVFMMLQAKERVIVIQYFDSDQPRSAGKEDFTWVK